MKIRSNCERKLCRKFKAVDRSQLFKRFTIWGNV